MVKMILLLKRRDGMSFEDFVAYYENHHSVLGKKILPTAIKYQRRFLKPIGDAMPDSYDCITEVWFADQAAMEAALASAATPTNAALLAEDEAKLFDRSKIRFYMVDQESPAD